MVDKIIDILNFICGELILIWILLSILDIKNKVNHIKDEIDKRK